MIVRIKPGVVLVAGLSFLGCARGADLQPSKSARVVARNVAEARAGGMVVRARGDVWPGASEVLDHVTPLQVWIENRGDQPIQIRYSEMSLQSSDGQTFRALAPWDIHGTVEIDVSVVPKSGPDSENTVTTYGGYTYTNVEAKPPLAIRSLPYYDHLYDHWTADVPLPTPDMNQMALPEARLEPRAETSGFVYFEPIPKGQQELVTLNVGVVNAASDALVAKAEIPFQR